MLQKRPQLELSKTLLLRLNSKIQLMIDLRSDTVTLPTSEMREFMSNAPVGDDVFSEDPTVNELEAYACQIFNKEAALFCSSGTQTNQIAIMIHTTPGGEVICHEDSHVYKYEGGGIARNSHASVKLLSGNRGRIKASQLPEAMNNPLDVHLPLTQLVSIEDTANRGGGAVYDLEEIKNIYSFCKEKYLPLHLDGARIFNALAVNKMNIQEYASYFDSISICLSKGLGAPIGSILLGSKDFIHAARRARKVLGGGMRQVGIIAAGGLFALKNHRDRISEDHAHAKLLESALSGLLWVEEILPVETNIVVVKIKDSFPRDLMIEKLKNKGILCIAFGPQMIRFVTHLNISSSDIETCTTIFKKL